MPVDLALSIGSILGIGALTYATFVGVGYLELRKKIDEQIAKGEQPYELKIEESRQKPSAKKSGKKRRR